MLPRKDEVEKFKSPGICHYEPNYAITCPKTKSSLPFIVKVNKNDPKLKIQKLWKSFKVYSEYRTVNFDSS